MKGASIFIVFLSLIFYSCTIEDNFTELTSHDDIIMETTVFLKDPAYPYRVEFIHYRTDGFNNLVEDYKGFSGSADGETVKFSFAVKEYKKAGLRIHPGENVSDIWINMYEVGRGKEIYFQYHHERVEDFTLMYDFETDSFEVMETELP